MRAAAAGRACPGSPAVPGLRGEALALLGRQLLVLGPLLAQVGALLGRHLDDLLVGLARLAPLKAEWESLEPERRRKWIGVAKRYPKMTPKGQERVQRRMQAWAKLSPEQRRQARETYKQIVKVPPEKRGNLRVQWAEYQQLPQHERESLVFPGEKRRR